MKQFSKNNNFKSKRWTTFIGAVDIKRLMDSYFM